jgi:hypothetical protein
MASKPMSDPPSGMCIYGKSHLESGYVASQAARSVLASGCRHLTSGQGQSA